MYFADTPHGRIPDGFHGAYQRMIGPWYLLQFMDGDEPVLAFAVSAYSTDLEIRNGIVREPVEGGEYFTFRAITGSTVTGPGFPVSPEEAIAHVHAVTGAKVVRVPELVLRNSAWSQFSAQWKLELDRPVTVETVPADGNRHPVGRSRVTELFVGPANSILLPIPDRGEGSSMPVAPRGTGRQGLIPACSA